MTDHHNEIADALSRALGQQVLPEFVAHVEESAGKAFLELRRDDLIRFLARSDQKLAALEEETASANAELTRRGELN